jgi:hypothetical protein
MFPGQRISVPAPLPPLANMVGAEPLFDANQPLRTIEFEPHVEAIQTVGGESTTYMRRWEMCNPENLPPHVTPEEINSMYDGVVKHAEANNMPSMWTVHRIRIGGTMSFIDYELYAKMLNEIENQVRNHIMNNVQPPTYIQGNGYMAHNTTWNDWASSTNGYRAEIYGTTSTNTNSTWNEWSSVGTAVGRRREETAEERQARDERAAEQAQQARERLGRWQQAQQAARDEAEKKAEKLMLSLLSRSQKKEYAEKSQITVPISRTSEIIITKGREGNLIERNPKTGSQKRWCVHITDQVPDFDNMAGQLLHLQTNPDAIMKLALPA